MGRAVTGSEQANNISARRIFTLATYLPGQPQLPADLAGV